MSGQAQKLCNLPSRVKTDAAYVRAPLAADQFHLGDLFAFPGGVRQETDLGTAHWFQTHASIGQSLTLKQIDALDTRCRSHIARAQLRRRQQSDRCSWKRASCVRLSRLSS